MDILLNNRIYMPRYDRVDDPFEGKHNIKGKVIFPRDDSREIILDLSPPDLRGCKIYSLSECPKIAPMWVQYADNFRGICIEFSTKSTFADIKQVKYVNSPITLNEVKWESIDYEKEVLLRKSYPWEYQKEWRLFHNDWPNFEEGKYLELEKMDIAAIILGENISPEYGNYFRDWGYKQNVTIKHTYIDENSYEVEIL